MLILWFNFRNITLYLKIIQEYINKEKIIIINISKQLYNILYI